MSVESPIAAWRRCTIQPNNVACFDIRAASRKTSVQKSQIDSRLVVHCVVDTNSFRALEAEWTILYEKCPNLSPFNSWDWLFSWWQSYGNAHALKILTFREDGRLVGIVPLYLSRERNQLGLACRVMRFVGDGSADSDYLGWLVADHDAVPVAAALTDWLSASNEWDALLLREMPKSCAMSDLMQASAKDMHLLFRREYGRCGILELPTSLESFLRERQARFRTKLRSLLKRLDQGGITFEVNCPPSTLRRKLRSMFHLHQVRWVSAGHPGVFGGSAKRLFYARFATRYRRRNWLRLYSLRTDRGYVAHQLCFQERDVVYLLQEAFDVSNPSSSYGQMLRAAVIRHLIESGGGRYDFLGGYSRHKETWGASENQTIHLAMARKSLRGGAYFYGPCVREQLAIIAKRVLPPRVTGWVKRMLERRSVDI